MKCIKYLTVSIFILALFTPVAIFAYTGQYSWDPIYLEPTQDTQNKNTKQRLKSQYGISAFYSCYPCAYKDTSNPYTETRCLIQTEYCLERQELIKETECSSGYVYFNGRCVTINQGCKENLGPGGYYTGKTDEKTGKYFCDCGSGYEWNDDDTACIKKTTISYPKGDIPDDVMKQALCLLGSNQHWDENGGSCICDSGYYKNDKRVCIKKEITVSPEIKGVDHLLFPEVISISEGALVRATNGIDIYIVKYVGSKKFKRLILNPSVFNNYGHLRWEDVMDVNQSTLDSFTTSELVRAVGDDKIYRLYAQGDTGQKRMIKNNSILTRLGLDPDSIYEINSFDRESYTRGLDLE